MPGHKGTETFVDIHTYFENRSIHMYISHCVKMRQQLMLLEDFKRQQGWQDQTDRKIRQWLVKIDRLRQKMIYTSGGLDLNVGDLEKLAKDMKLELPKKSETKDAGDMIARSSGRPFETRFKFDGSTDNVPTLSKMEMRNVDAFTLIQALDLHIVDASRLDSRKATRRITAEEGVQLYSGLFEMWQICDQFGGTKQMIGVTEGTLPEEEPQGSARSGGVLGEENVETRPGSSD